MSSKIKKGFPRRTTNAFSTNRTDNTVNTHLIDTVINISNKPFEQVLESYEWKIGRMNQRYVTITVELFTYSSFKITEPFHIVSRKIVFLLNKHNY